MENVKDLKREVLFKSYDEKLTAEALMDLVPDYFKKMYHMKIQDGGRIRFGSKYDAISFAAADVYEVNYVEGLTFNISSMKFAVTLFDNDFYHFVNF
jgi:hypothetical protein